MNPLYDNGRKKVKRSRHFKLTQREANFARLIVDGRTQADAYRETYNPATSREASIGLLGHRVANRRRVVDEIARLRAKAAQSTLLSLNERLKCLSAVILNPMTKASDVIQAIAVYSRISGDQSPERQEHSGPSGAPIQVQAVSSIVHRMPAMERLRLIKAERAARERAEAAAQHLTPAADTPAEFSDTQGPLAEAAESRVT